MIQNHSDLLLFEAVKTGDENAFEVLFKLYYAVLCEQSCSIVADEMQAEEIVSDFLFKVWQNKQSIVIQSSVKGYFVSAVRNMSLNHLKANSPQIVDLSKVAPAMESDEPQPLDAIISEESVQQWEKRIGALPQQRQKVFRMNKLDGMNYQQIAKELCLSEKTVRNHVQLALKTLTSLKVLHTFVLLLTLR